MRDEEAEALRLQREAAAGLRPEDFGQSDEDEEGEGEEEGSSSEEEGEGEPWVKEGTWLGGRMWRPIWVLRITRCCCSLAGTRVLSCLLTISLTVASPCTTGADAAADEEETLGAAAAAAAGGMQVERVAKDLGSLSSEQRLAAVQRDAPELLQLIAELREGLTEVRSRVGPLLNEVGGCWRWGYR